MDWGNEGTVWRTSFYEVVVLFLVGNLASWKPQQQWSTEYSTFCGISFPSTNTLYPHLLESRRASKPTGQSPHLPSTSALGSQSDGRWDNACHLKILSRSSRPVKPRLPTALLVRRPFISIIYVIDICFLSWRQFDGDFESFHNESETLASGDPQATGKKDTKACIACAV